MIKIYIDVYFFLNFAVDFLSLFSVQRLLLFPESKLRCALGGALGAIWSVICFIYPIPPICHLPILFLSVYIITYGKNITKTLSGVPVFIFAQIFIGGAVTATKNLCRGIEKQSLFYAGMVMLIAFLGYEVYCLLELLMKKRLSRASVEAIIEHRGRSTKLLLLVDSGNLVTERTTMRRVLFIKAKALEKAVGDCDTVFEREKCYVIPIETASGRSSVMGFIPDKIEFTDKNYNEAEFMVVPDMQGGKFAGYDGIAPLM